MSLVNNSANNFKDFLDAIKPYLNYQFYDLSGQGVEANNFSTDEKVIGTWIDGKPLYQKTIDVTTPSDVTDGTFKNNSIDVRDLSIDKMICCSAFFIHSLYGTYFCNPLMCSNDGSQLKLNYDGNGYINIQTNKSLFSGLNGKATLRYTKTTDSAVASGEKIVGQWVDGKPLYEKTVDCGALPNNSYTSVPSGIDNFEMLIDIKAIASNSSNDSVVAPSYYISGSNDDYSLSVKMSQSNILIKTYATWEGQASYSHVYVTLRYTKSS